MAQSTPANSYCSRASFRCAYMHHIEKYVFQQKSCAPGLELLLLQRTILNSRKKQKLGSGRPRPRSKSSKRQKLLAPTAYLAIGIKFFCWFAYTARNPHRLFCLHRSVVNPQLG